MKKRALLLLVPLALISCYTVRRLTRPGIPPEDEATRAHVRNVEILRDRFGVPHVYGKSDADAAFGLAYAHAEDDWDTIQKVIAAGRGQLGRIDPGKQSAIFDYYAQLIDVRGQVARGYASLDPDVRAVLEGYARGLTHWARHHPGEVDTRFLPVTGEDIAGGFAHKLTIMVGLPQVLQSLLSGPERKAGERLAMALREDERAFPGSNAQAVSSTRSADGVTRLNINSHQPWTGPVAWYEAQVVSEEGWNMTGGLFPGSPFILHGHNEHLGWAFTVNFPDVIDVFRLETRGDDGYVLDGRVEKLRTYTATMPIDAGVLEVPLHRKVEWSRHGPVLRNGDAAYAVRWAGIGHGVFATQQWFRMNKARSFEEWRAAMGEQAIPMFHAVYADARHIHYLYNALLFDRPAGHDWESVLPGNDSALIVDRYLPLDRLPQVTDPTSGFVQACNSSPFSATLGPEAPRPEDFPASAGLETTVSNRGKRTLELFGAPGKIDRARFLAMKWDRAYVADSDIVTEVVEPLATRDFPSPTAGEVRALELRRGWDRTTSATSAAATIAILTLKAHDSTYRAAGDPGIPDIRDALRDTVEWLEESRGKVDVPLGEVQRLRRGKLDLPLAGGPDVLNAIYTKRRSDHLEGIQGDSYILLVEIGPTGVRSESINVFGASNVATSPHYADQSPLFVANQLKPTWRQRPDLEQNLERRYHPGEER